PPYITEITPYVKTGTNNIEVQVINTWNNRIIGDLRYPDEKSYTRTNIKYKFSKDNKLLKSGLTGKAEIIFVKSNE
ncbi:MAG TPA: hypothetical protein DEQ09_01455, partial [Bacteroidales bacterium]|nr:hypothetical protein [Bacteroidales bacterium]